MRHRSIPVAAIQTRAADRSDFVTIWPRVLALVERAGRHGARLIVLPEGTVPGYVLGPEPVEEATLVRARTDVARLAREFSATIVYGTARVDGAHTFNSASVIGPSGDELGFADKGFLWHFDRRWFAPSCALAPIETPIGVLGVLICADGRIPTLARMLVERGAEVLVMPTAWVTSGRDPSALENVQADLLANVRARENGVPFLAANKCGVERESVAYCGKSAIVDRFGAFVSRANERDETVIYGEIELGEPARTHSAVLRVAERAADTARRKAVRIAFTATRELAALERLARTAAEEDVNVMIAPDAPAIPARELGDANLEFLSIAQAAEDGVLYAALGAGAAGLLAGIVDDAIAENPAGLVEARLAGIDLFVWSCGLPPAEAATLARARALELRAYVVVIPRAAGDRQPEQSRAFAVDPDGAIVAGTFDGFQLAAFTYDPAKSGATTVAPHTDVLEGLRAVARLRERSEVNVAFVE